MQFGLCTEFAQNGNRKANISDDIKSVEIDLKPLAFTGRKALKLFHIVEYL
jgi:hypothetical protein